MFEKILFPRTNPHRAENTTNAEPYLTAFHQASVWHMSYFCACDRFLQTFSMKSIGVSSRCCHSRLLMYPSAGGPWALGLGSERYAAPMNPHVPTWGLQRRGYSFGSGKKYNMFLSVFNIPRCKKLLVAAKIDVNSHAHPRYFSKPSYQWEPLISGWNRSTAWFHRSFNGIVPPPSFEKGCVLCSQSQYFLEISFGDLGNWQRCLTCVPHNTCGNRIRPPLRSFVSKQNSSGGCMSWLLGMDT